MTTDPTRPEAPPPKVPHPHARREREEWIVRIDPDRFGELANNDRVASFMLGYGASSTADELWLEPVDACDESSECKSFYVYDRPLDPRESSTDDRVDKIGPTPWPTGTAWSGGRYFSTGDAWIGDRYLRRVPTPPVGSGISNGFRRVVWELAGLDTLRNKIANAQRRQADRLVGDPPGPQYGRFGLDFGEARKSVTLTIESTADSWLYVLRFGPWDHGPFG